MNLWRKSLLKETVMPDNMNDKSSFLDTIIKSVKNLKTLEIRTIIGAFQWNESSKKIEYKPGEVKAIITQIDLLEGDITTAFSDEFLREPYDQIRDFHLEREKRGQEIIAGNLKAIQELIKTATQVFNEQEKSAT
jgi:hypothetical protein